jgi:hypothetical protein
VAELFNDSGRYFGDNIAGIHAVVVLRLDIDLYSRRMMIAPLSCPASFFAGAIRVDTARSLNLLAVDGTCGPIPRMIQRTLARSRAVTCRIQPLRKVSKRNGDQ